MAIIVSDTSAIRALHHLQQLALISKMCGELFVPPAVDAELHSTSRNFPGIDLPGLGLATVRIPSQSFLDKLAPFDLDPGETEAIALALEVKADYLLIDETKGRAAADQLGVRYTGVLGILIEAKRRGFLVQVAPLLVRLRKELRFHISPRLEREALRRIGEVPEVE